MTKLLTSTLLPLAVVCAMGVATPSFADSHEGEDAAEDGGE